MITMTEKAVTKLQSIQVLMDELVRDGKISIIKGETDREKIMELYYLDQIGHHIVIHYDTNKKHCRVINRDMNIEAVVV